ncbi:hypothetical protein BS47DRAFT_1373353 [Hydnum rufescens UP504]|uniref:Uncharacterized protein n=1 Tax=Hydnum rufescens UP504 TaxID=1448309 RepID=A0A9P6DU47_9AGAM|nr:hypothetical protein BS47DRAFT_1373353 [Hydnum rufescens UP504]
MPTPTKKKRSSKKNLRPDIPPEELALEHSISRILLLRYQQDIARLFSTHIHHLALVELPRFVMSALNIAPPGWLAVNAASDDVKDFFRSALALDMRQAGERVATKKPIRHFAVSHSVPLCGYRGLHSHLLLPHHSHMRAHLKMLEALPPPKFSKPPHLGSLAKGYATLERYCLDRVKNTPAGSMPPQWNDWKLKIHEGYDRVVETLICLGYGLVLREKLTDKWCCLSCLGTVCEPTVRTVDDHKPICPSKGKEREWDGRGSGEDVWRAKLDFGGSLNDDLEIYPEDEDAEDAMTVGELMEWRYIKAEREKELGNSAFKKGAYDLAIRHYEGAYRIEAEIPHYQLNIAAAHLKLSKKAILRLQSNNADAVIELESLRTSRRPNLEVDLTLDQPSTHAALSSPASCSHSRPHSPASPKLRYGQTMKLNDKPIPFQTHERDTMKLKIQFLPLTIQIDPDVGTGIKFTCVKPVCLGGMFLCNLNASTSIVVLVYLHLDNRTFLPP